MTVFIHDGVELNTDLITKSDMPSELFKEVYELCGVDTAVSLLINMPGNIIQIPTRGFLNIQKKILLKNYDGTTASLRKLAREFKIPEMTIRKILADYKIQIPQKSRLNFFKEENNGKNQKNKK